MSLMLLAAVLAADPPAAGHWVGDNSVVPPAATFILVRAKAGGVEALDLATGKPLWRNADADRIAGGSDKFALTWAGDAKTPSTFRVTVVDAATGKTAATSDPIVMPDWATTSRELYGKTFRTAARVEGDTAVVAWWAGAHYAGGPPLPREALEAARKHAAGLVAVDLKTGKVTGQGRDRPPGAADAGPKEADFGTGGLKVAGLEFVLDERPAGAGAASAVTLTATKGGKELWKRELAGNRYYPPPP